MPNEHTASIVRITFLMSAFYIIGAKIHLFSELRYIFIKKEEAAIIGSLFLFIEINGLYLPGVAAVEQVVHAFVFAVGHLLLHLLFVELGVADFLDVADDAQSHG